MTEIFIAVIFFLLVSNIFFIYKFKTTANKYFDVSNNQKGHSEELTEFLQDQKNLGYSFIRVDPVSVFIRSPK